MESIRKIIKIMFLGIMVICAFEGVGQNIYEFPTLYYNMDTNRCVKDRDESTLAKDSIGLYCEFWASVEMPILNVEDKQLINMIDSCVDAAKGYLQYPDSSGYFVELILFERYDDPNVIGFAVRPISNYYMGILIVDDLDAACYEWFGYGNKDLHGGFYWNNVLCVVASSFRVDFMRASCLFSPTQDTMKLKLYRPTRCFIDHDQERISVTGEYYFDECIPTQESDDLQKSVKISFAK